MRSMSAGLRRIAWLVAGVVALTVPLIMAPTASSAAGRTATVAPAPPTARVLAAANVSASGSRRVVVRTTDRRPGGKLEADITWWGKGPFNGRVYGSVQDVEADGFCVVAEAWAAGHRYTINVPDKHGKWLACPAGDAKSVYFRFTKTWRVLVRVCLWKKGYLYYCSPWK
jgi:hypothetical protein